MNLKELKGTIDFTISTLHKYESPEDIPVLITLSEPSVGSRASSGVIYVGTGIDWEHGQLRIEPEQKLVRKGNAKTDVIPSYEHTPYGGGRKVFICKMCGCQVGKDDRYCKHCGQRLR